jgi:hypothetical protein
MPRALEVFWEVMEEANMESRTRLATLEQFDDVLGLGLREMKEKKIKRQSLEVKARNQRLKSVFQNLRLHAKEQLQNTIKKNLRSVLLKWLAG